MKPLDGRVALVAGATRGAGRGIARMLGEAGATVWCTGRSAGGERSELDRPETVEETAELVTAAGGHGIAVRCDHRAEADVSALVGRIRSESGRLDVLVSSLWGGDPLTEWGRPFWELSLDTARRLLENAVLSHLVTARHATPLLLESGRGLIVEVTDGDSHGYRGNLPYDLAKLGTIRLGYAMAADLRGRPVTALTVTPGFLRSEAVLDHFGVTEATWREAIAADPHFEHSETPCFVGRGIAALAADPDVARWRGKLVASWTLAREYDLEDVDGRRPDWGTHFDGTVVRLLEGEGELSELDRLILLTRYWQVHRDPSRTELAGRLVERLGEDPGV